MFRKIMNNYDTEYYNLFILRTPIVLCNIKLIMGAKYNEY